MYGQKIIQPCPEGGGKMSNSLANFQILEQWLRNFFPRYKILVQIPGGDRNYFIR